jgi:prepilin-type N-terminal cleavage/methylation domain-containing protein
MIGPDRGRMPIRGNSPNKKAKKTVTTGRGKEMIRRSIRKLHKGQGGFTLIEVLVVMTILGILAAIVSISLLGVTASARTKAKAAEKQTVQAAFDAMLSDQQVKATDVGAACDGSHHDLMTVFPIGKAYDAAPSGPDTTLVNVLATHYLREQSTTYDYWCNSNGDVFQSDTPGPTPAR